MRRQRWINVAAVGLGILLGGVISTVEIADARQQPPMPSKGVPAARPRGAIPTHRAKILAAPKHVQRAGVPASFAAIPAQLSYWLNDVDGDCVTAEEAFAKAAYSVMLGLPETLIPDSSVQTWAKARGFLNGANLTDVMDAMASSGLVGSDGKTYDDGPYTSVDYTNDTTLRSAIFTGPVKIGVAADQLQNTVGVKNGWVATGYRNDSNEDHCVSLCGFGTMAQCCEALGVPVPAGANGTGLAYLLFTWKTVGVIDQASLIAITGEAWLRNPTTPGQSPTPVPTPTPVPVPVPTPVPTPTPTPIPTPVPTPTPTPNPVPVPPVSTALTLIFDPVAKTITLPVGYTARNGIYPSQINIHVGADFIAVPAGWTPIAPVTGVETMP